MSARSDAVLERLMRLHPKVIDLSLGRIETLLAGLDHPERRLPPVVHVAGTNGKGSLIAFLRAMLEAEGRRVHVYTSPHLVRFHERIRLAGDLIAEPALLALLEECERANGTQPITFFEVTTAAALLAFARAPADLLLLEVGLGGRLDATNVVARPRLTAITPVSMDHMQFLGDDLAGIAGEKAGILKPGVPCVVAAQAPAALVAIEAQAARVGAPLLLQGRDWDATATADGFRLRGPRGNTDWPRPALAGDHQIGNAGQALVCAALLEDLAPGAAACRRGLAQVRWPARLQRLTRGPLVEMLPAGWELWLDGGHNAAAGAMLAAAAQGWHDQPLHLVCGMLNSKAVEDFLRPLAGVARDLQAVAIPGETATLSAEQTAGHAAACGLAAAPRDSLRAAVGAIVEGAGSRNDGPPGRILICGSLYLAGRVLAEHG